MKKLLSIAFICCLFSTSGFAQVLYDDLPLPNPNQAGSRYALLGSSWDHKFITYHIQNTTSDMNANTAREVIRWAFNSWQAVTRLYFVEVCDPAQADIVLLWASGNHGDGSTFTGPNLTLAHAFSPPPLAPTTALAGDVHFDEAEDWTTDYRSGSSQPIDLYSVALHEIGHALGLAHSAVNSAVMEAFYDGSRRTLTNDDIDGMRSLYGANIDFFSGPAQFCESASYSLNETVPAGYTAAWSISNAPGMVIIPGANGVTLDNYGHSGFVTLTLTLTQTNGCGTINFSKQIQVGDPANQVTMSGPSALCNGSAVYTLNNFPAGATASWLTGPYATITLLNANGSQVSVTSNGTSGVSSLLATLDFAGAKNCLANTIISKPIQYGKPTYSSQVPYITQNGNTTYMNDCNVITQITGGKFYSATGYVTDALAGTYTWSKVGGPPGSNFNWSASGNTFQCNVKTSYPNDWIILRCTVTNSCGSGYRDYRFTPNPNGCPILVGEKTSLPPAPVHVLLAPNPSTGQFSISLQNAQKENGIQQVMVLNKTGRTVFSRSFNGNPTTVQINLPTAGTDIYVVKVFNGKNWFTEKLSVKK